MENNAQGSQAAGFGLSDIYYMFFRHKWKIAIISAVGVLAVALLYLVWPLPYQSEARLFVKYVIDTRNPGQVGPNTPRVTSPDDRGENVLNTELEVLSSFDLALQVANSVGPSNLLAKAGGGTNPYVAAALIRKNLTLEVPKRSSVIHLVFQHPDPAICQPVLAAIIDDYYKMHLKIHRDAGEFDDFLTLQTDQLHSRLLQTEEALRAARTNLGVVSIESTKRAYGEQIAQVQEQILAASAELAERQAEVDEITRSLQALPAASTNAAVTTTNLVVPPQKISEYKRVCSLLDSLTRKEQDLLTQFTPENATVKAVQDRISVQETAKSQLEAEFPGLLTVRVTGSKSGSGDLAGGPRPDLTAPLAKIKGLQSRIKLLNQQLDELQTSAAKLNAAEGTIADLERRFSLQQTQYQYFSMSLEQSRIDEALGPGRVSNISQIQLPSPPSRDSAKLQKLALGLLLGSFALAFAVAFVLEFYLDQSLKRPSEVESRLGLNLLLSVPMMDQISQLGQLGAGSNVPLLAQNNSEPPPNGAAAPPSPAPAPWDPQHALRPFAEALRDRLINFFDIKGLTHKPKLVALTSCGEGSGVSTIAAGLASCLSETGDGSVLLVDMNDQDGATRKFFKGNLDFRIDDALEDGKRKQALVQDNLYVVSEAGGLGLPQVLPKRFRHLVPKLKASNYDYIIFDMPPVSQVSMTPRLAPFMDMMLMVVESEKTNREVIKRASALLAETKTNVGVVLNKRRNYLPPSLREEI